MRVCIVTIAGHGVGGMQDHTRDLARGLVAAGHDVEVITTRHPKGLRTEKRNGAWWHFVDAPGRHERLPFHHPGWLRESYALFERLHFRQPFDVVHSESTSALEFVRRGVHRRVPFVVLYHGNFVGMTRAAWQRARAGSARERLREAKGFVWMCGTHVQRGECFRFRNCEWMVPAVQQFDGTRRGDFLRASLGHVVPNGVDPAVFRPREKAQLRVELDLPEGLLLICVGRLNREKGLDVALRAFASLVPAHTDARLVVVGIGEEERRLRSLADDLGITQQVSFVGSQPADRVAAYLAAADVFLFPTRREEAAPLVLPQAMASGLPVVASRIGGVSEVIGEGGVNGFLVEPGDVRGVAEACGRLLDDKDLRHRLGRAARRRVLDEYTVERMVERTVVVYETAAERLTAKAARSPHWLAGRRLSAAFRHTTPSKPGRERDTELPESGS
jgi:glycosyltransferase involved in cell wall biosynthesis